MCRRVLSFAGSPSKWYSPMMTSALQQARRGAVAFCLAADGPGAAPIDTASSVHPERLHEET